MDPLSFTVSIVAVLQAANSVISFSIKLRNDIQDHATEVISLAWEIKELRNVLEELADVAELANEEPGHAPNTNKRARLHSLSLLCGPSAAMAMCHKDLTTLERKLSKDFSRGKFSGAVARAAGWSRIDEDIKLILARLDRYKHTFQLALVQDEARLLVQIENLMLETSKGMTDVQESVYAFCESYKYAGLDEKRRNILHWLSHADPVASNTDALRLLQEGTCSWFLDSTEFQSWKTCENRFLWIYGPPGAGKTMLSASIIDSLLKTSTASTTAVAYFYCDFRRAESQKAENLVGSLAAQLFFQSLNSLHWLDDAYSKSRTFTGSMVPPEEKFLAEAVVTLVKELNKKIYIVLDALDECDDRSKLLPFLRDLAAGSMNVSVIATSRDTKDIRNVFENSTRLTLDNSSDGMLRDIKLCIDTRLQNDPAFAWLKQEVKTEISEKLLADSENPKMFRWIQFQLDELSCLRQVNAVRKALKEFPHGLEDTYMRILQRVPTRNRKVVQRSLLWLSLSVLPMTLNELCEAIAIDTDNSGVDEGELLSSPFDIVDMCGNLAVASDINHAVTLAHLSVKEYLLSSSIMETEIRSFALSEEIGYQTLTTFCLSYLSAPEFRTGPATTPEAWAHRNDAHPFLAYASRVWPQYAILAGQPDEIVCKINQFFKLESGRSFMSWVQVINASIGWENYPPWGSPLYYSASFGLDKVVSSLIQEDPNPVSINNPGSRNGGTALHGAVLRQHPRVMKLLLEAGADHNRSDDNRVPPLHTAAIYGNVEVTSLLLDYGAWADESFGGGTPLQWARTCGHQEVVDILVRWEQDHRKQEAS